MCKFCEDYSRYKTFRVPVRSSYTDDNFCEKIRDCDCRECNGCSDDNFHFALYSWENGIWLGYHHQMNCKGSDEDIVVSQTSEGLYFNYCPWCGRKLTE